MEVPKSTTEEPGEVNPFPVKEPDPERGDDSGQHDGSSSVSSGIQVPEPPAGLFMTQSEKNFLAVLKKSVKTSVEEDEALGDQSHSSPRGRRKRRKKKREAEVSGLVEDLGGDYGSTRDSSRSPAGRHRRKKERRAAAAGKLPAGCHLSERSDSLSDDPGLGCINQLFGEIGDYPALLRQLQNAEADHSSVSVVFHAASLEEKDEPGEDEEELPECSVISVELHVTEPSHHHSDDHVDQSQSGNASATTSNENSDASDPQNSSKTSEPGNTRVNGNPTQSSSTVDPPVKPNTLNVNSGFRGPASDLMLIESGFGVTPLDTAPLLMDDEGQESALRIVSEIMLPFLLAGLGCVVAGLVLDHVKHWPVFQDVSEIFILVPALLGLKGNLEMTLASRLSTQANIGNMDKTSEQWNMIGGNLALTQAQAIIVGLLAAVFAIALGWVPEGKFNIMHGFLLCTGSVLTAALASFVLGSVMVGVIVVSRKFKINPDNVATPIAASLGDLTTISLLAGISMFLYNTLDGYDWLAPLLLCATVALIPLWWIISHRNIYTHEVLYAGWTPVIGAMIISSIGGLVLDHTVVSYEGVAVFQPVINGVGGNLVAVQASRLSTALHRVSTPGILPDNAVQGCPHPLQTFLGKGISSRTARVLLLMVVPGQIVFMFTISFAQSDGVEITFAFVVIYLTATLIQVATLLFIANWLVHLLWRRGIDPDNSSIPYLTAIGDLLGTVLLAASFFILSYIEPSRIRPSEGGNNGSSFFNMTTNDSMVTTAARSFV